VQQVEIRVHEHLDEYWSDWFDGLRIAHRDRDGTVLSGAVVDQAALYALLTKLRDAGLTLASISCGELEGRSADGSSGG
jgi:hypothetical protein